MTELEQLRKELNELRERIVVLEQKQPKPAVGTPQTGNWGEHFYKPSWAPNVTPLTYPPGVRTIDPYCSTTGIQECGITKYDAPTFNHGSQ